MKTRDSAHFSFEHPRPVRTSSSVARWALSLVVKWALSLVIGCAAGYPPASMPEDRENDLVALRAGRVQQIKTDSGGGMSSAAEALEEDLLLSDAGKVIARAIRAHGGWDAWRALSRVQYVRDRIAVDSSGRPVTGHEAQNTAFEVRVEDDGKIASAPTPGAADEEFLFGLPFVLADAALRKEYEGVEIDAKTGELFEKVRCIPAGSADWLVASFDRSTGVLKRLLRQRDGKFTLTIFSAWRDVDGVKVATKRSTHRLESLFDHRDMGRPDSIDVLGDVTKVR